MKVDLDYWSLMSKEASTETFNDFREAAEYCGNVFNSNTINEHWVVYLIVQEDSDNEQSIFVTCCTQMAFQYLLYMTHDNTKHTKGNSKISIHEFDSYEEAYIISLSMQETNELCYSKDNFKHRLQ